LNQLSRLSLVVACTSLLAACGGGAKLKPGKENAAAAAYAASQGAGGAQGSLLDLARQNAGAQLDLAVDCPKGGQAKIHYIVDGTAASGAVNFTLTYAGCNYNGKTQLNGTLSTSMTLAINSTSVALNVKMTGRVDFSGEISDFVDINVTETVGASKLNTTQGASVSVTFDGSIKTSTETYTYNHEAINVTAGRYEGNPS